MQGSNRQSSRWPRGLEPFVLATATLAFAMAPARAGAAEKWQFQQQLAPDAVEGAQAFGAALAVEGDLLAIGAPARGGGGAVYLYGRQQVAWTPRGVTPLTLSQPQGADGLGHALAIYGGTVVAAAPRIWGGATASVHVYEASGGSFVEVAVLENPEPDDASFATAVAIGSAGILVGAPGFGGGSVYWYGKGQAGWPPIPTDTLPKLEVAGEQFGSSIAMQGATVVVGAPGASDSTGAAYVFVWDGTDWSSGTPLVPQSLAAYSAFGYAVALSGDTAVVGAFGANDSAGAAYAFTRANGVWDVGSPLTPSTPLYGGQFGFALASSQSTVLVAEPYAGPGAAHAFTSAAASWSWAATLADADGAAGDGFGTAAAVQGDLAFVGAPSKGSGRVTIFGLADGYACAGDAECANGHCAEGVCCDSACDGVCQSCLAARKQAGSDGTCDVVLAATDPGETCEAAADTCGTTGLCDAHGQCAFGEVGSDCGGPICSDHATLRVFFCDGKGECQHTDAGCGLCACKKGACNNGCSADDDCIESAFCDANNECQAKGALTSECSRDGQCDTGHCVDGICCDTACSGQCEACNEPDSSGTCSAVHGQPRGEREACAPDAIEPCGALSCDGETRTACVQHPDETTLCDLSDCEQAACDGRGGCQCLSEQHCSATKTAQVDPAGNSTDCAPFICRDGRCLDACRTTNDCSPSFSCNEDTHQCEKILDLKANPGCQLRPAASRSMSPFAWTITLLVLGGIRRRPRRNLAPTRN